MKKAGLLSSLGQIKMFQEHGMSQMDFYDFYEEFGVKEFYKLKDVRNFLGY
jgi:hypothetical protein